MGDDGDPLGNRRGDLASDLGSSAGEGFGLGYGAHGRRLASRLLEERQGSRRIPRGDAMTRQLGRVGSWLGGFQEICQRCVQETPSVGQEPPVGRVEEKLVAESPLVRRHSELFGGGDDTGGGEFLEIRLVDLAAA